MYVYQNTKFSLAVITNRTLQWHTRARTAVNHVELIDFDSFAELLQEMLVRNGALASLLFERWKE